MASTLFRNTLGQLGGLLNGRLGAPTPDQELLTRFLRERDQDAFAILMGRHAAMVLGVCQRVLRNAHDAEDACQAVFLVLARKAGSVRKRGSLASWLHGVARRVACKLQKSLARRAARESMTAAAKPALSEPADLSWREALHIVDEEIQRLPAIYQEPVVLCYLEGRTQDEAARELGLSLGALRGRLNRGRDKLRENLVRRGITGAAALSLAALVPALGSAAVPPALIAASAQASVSMAGPSTQVLVPQRVAALARDGLQTLWNGKLVSSLVSGVVGVCVALLGIVLTLLAGFRPLAEPNNTPVEAVRTWSEARRLEIPGFHLYSVAFSPDGKWVAAGAVGVIPAPGELRVWDVASGSVVYSRPTPGAVRCVRFSPDGQSLAIAEHDGSAKVLKAATGRVIHELRGHGSRIDAAVFSPDGKTMATCSWDGTVKLWNAERGKEIRTFSLSTAQLWGVSFCSNDVLAAGGADGVVRICQTATGRTLFRLRGHSNSVHCLASSPGDGKLLATASWDKTVRLWDTTDGKPVATLYGHTEPVLSVAFSRDGRTLASGSGVWGDGVADMNVPNPSEVILWDLTAQQARARLPHRDRVFGVAFSPDGNMLAVAGWDGAVTLWKAEVDDRPLPDKTLKDGGGLRFVLAAAQDATGGEPFLKREYAEEYHPTLTEANEVPGLLLYGPQAAECVKFESQGLRITLPAGYPRQRPGTGVVTEFGVRGDFEITLSYEILQEPRSGVETNPTGLRLVVVPDERPVPEAWQKTSQNRAVLSRELASPGDMGQFVADATKWTLDIPRDQWGNESFNNVEAHEKDYAAAKASSGRLRLVRRGPTLLFYTSDGADKDFSLLHKDTFGAKDVKNVRVLGSTGGPRPSLDVRVNDLHIRADSFIPIGDSPAVVRAAGGKWWWYVLSAVAVGVAAACSLGIWLYARTRCRAAVATVVATVVADEVVSQAISFKCPGCGRSLRAKNIMAGAKVKCPRCGQPVRVPANEQDIAEELS